MVILARSSREMSQTVRIGWQYILSRVRVSVRPRFFYTPKTPKTLGTWAASASVYFNGQRPVLSPAERAVAVGIQRIDITCMAAAAVCVSVCLCVQACARMRARGHACVMCLHCTIIIFDPR